MYITTLYVIAGFGDNDETLKWQEVHGFEFKLINQLKV